MFDFREFNSRYKEAFLIKPFKNATKESHITLLQIIT